MPEPRFDAAMAAAWQILTMAGIPATPVQLGQVADAVLEAIHEAESRLAERPGRMLLCGGCLISIPAWPGEASRPCPGCQRMMGPPESVGRN